MLNVGIDLGTSRSAISSSNGEQFVVDSFVGWPADLVARKVVATDGDPSIDGTYRLV